MEYIDVAATAFVHPSTLGKVTVSTTLPFQEEDGYVLEYTHPDTVRRVRIDFLTAGDLRGIIEAARAVLTFAPTTAEASATSDSLAATAYDDGDRVAIEFDVVEPTANVAFRYGDDHTLWLDGVTSDGFDRLATLFATAAATLRKKE